MSVFRAGLQRLAGLLCFILKIVSYAFRFILLFVVF